MFEVYKFSEAEIIFFALMLIRTSVCISLMPIFGAKTIPRTSKVLLSLVITLVLFPVLQAKTQLPASWKDEIILLAAREALVGAFMGYLTRLLFMSVEIAGQILGFTMGFTTAQLVNPTFGDTVSVLEQFETILATLLFLAINGHHLLLEAVHQSFRLAPLGSLAINPKAFASVTEMIQHIFIIAVKLSGPMIAVMIFLNLAMGVVGRAVPQINVFVTSFPVNILVGLSIFMVSIPLVLAVLEVDFIKTGEMIFLYLKGF